MRSGAALQRGAAGGRQQELHAAWVPLAIAAGWCGGSCTCSSGSSTCQRSLGSVQSGTTQQPGARTTATGPAGHHCIRAHRPPLGGLPPHPATRQQSLQHRQAPRPPPPTPPPLAQRCSGGVGGAVTCVGLPRHASRVHSVTAPSHCCCRCPTTRPPAPSSPSSPSCCSSSSSSCGSWTLSSPSYAACPCAEPARGEGRGVGVSGVTGASLPPPPWVATRQRAPPPTRQPASLPPPNPSPPPHTPTPTLVCCSMMASACSTEVMRGGDAERAPPPAPLPPAPPAAAAGGGAPGAPAPPPVIHAGSTAPDPRPLQQGG